MGATCKTCAPGYFLESGRCLKCLTGCRVCSETTRCEECEADHDLGVSGRCCPGGCESCSSALRCDRCRQGFRFDFSALRCLPCDPGCQACTRNFDWKKGGYYGQCVMCKPGFALINEVCQGGHESAGPNGANGPGCAPCNNDPSGDTEPGTSCPLVNFRALGKHKELLVSFAVCLAFFSLVCIAYRVYRWVIRQREAPVQYIVARPGDPSLHLNPHQIQMLEQAQAANQLQAMQQRQQEVQPHQQRQRFEVAHEDSAML